MSDIGGENHRYVQIIYKITDDLIDALEYKWIRG